MSEQIFISYRRDGGDITARLVCETLKGRGFSVFYDIESIHGGYFDHRILTAIEGCNDFLLILSPHSLDRCVNEGDWVRQEIAYALKCGRNIVPVMLPGFAFPITLPDDIAAITRYNGVKFVMEYFEAVMNAIVDRCTARPIKQAPPAPKGSAGLEFKLNDDGKGYTVIGIGECKDTEIVIPETYQGKPVTSIGPLAFLECKALTSITIPEGVKSIGPHAFLECKALTSITIPEGVKSIGNSAFSFCDALTGITIPSSVTSIGVCTFLGCDALTSITIPSSVTCIGDSAFFGCGVLTRVTITSSVTSIGIEAFSLCKALTNICFEGTCAQWGTVLKYADSFEEVPATVVHCLDGDVSL